MTARAIERLVADLRERGVIDADAPAPPTAELERPWFLSLLQGAAGWLAGVFLLIFAGLLLEPDDTATLVVIGLVLLAAAWTIYRRDREAVFLDQFALALSIAGQIAIAWGLLEGNPSMRVVTLTLLVLQLAVFAVMPNRIARTLAAFFATVAWVHVVRAVLLPMAGGHSILGYGEPAAPLLGAWTQPAGWLLTWVPLLVLAIWLVRRETRWMALAIRDHARAALTGVLLGLAIGGISASPLEWFAWGNVPGVGMEFSWQSLFPLLSIGLALCAAYAAFRLRSAGLLGFAIVAAAASVALLLSLRHHVAVEVADHAGARCGAARSRGRAASPSSRGAAMTSRVARVAMAATVLLVLAVVNACIVGKERIKVTGERVLLELAPVDPRSLMQGDYMALRFALADDIRAEASGKVPVTLDANRVARFDPDAKPDSLRIRYRVRHGQVWLGTNAYFFEEGAAQRFEGARYGEFRVDRDSGEAVLVGLVGPDFQAR